MKTLTIELSDEVFEMLEASARQNGRSMAWLSALHIESFVRSDQHVVWDMEIIRVAGDQTNRRDFRRGDVVQSVETETRGIVVDATGNRVRVAVDRNVKMGFRPGDTIVGPESVAAVTDGSVVAGLKAHTWSIFNDDAHGRFDQAA